MTPLQFNPETHVYSRDGVRVPGVTDVMVASGLIDTRGPWFTAWHRQRGEYVHEATALDDRGELDEDTLDPAILPYVLGWREFLKTTGSEILDIERVVENTVYPYAGKLDRLVMLGGRRFVLDIKTGQPERWHGVQLAGYAGCFDAPPLRMGVYLDGDGDGDFHLKQYSDSHDWNVFLAALTIARFLEKR